MSKSENILFRLKGGEPVSMEEPEYDTILSIVSSTIKLSPGLNNSTSTGEARKRLGEIIGAEIDESTTVFVPFFTNFGRFISLGKNVFINHACSFLDMGGITIEDDVLIGPKVNLITENHPLDPANRRTLVTKPIVIKRNAWLGAGVTILPGVTVGENAVVAAGAVVSRDVPDNTIVAGVPAKVVKSVPSQVAGHS
ncbi:DapH/DapD/GlmU-related protein [Chitinophaga filiformis]|uniref:Acetyltransferase (Isoleucine patch superfamily) n=1 Tax=Chitinophaga filiformis TaxID=104663 RepID=A0A1G7XNS0_CHIFI|nr:DapH/DapD/GlmU-related protein [Chitinophaga filiformis]SDG85706.1 Acetyltransferase (isoleucine patch superfamily) [Chitinophaga filiformis]